MPNIPNGTSIPFSKIPTSDLRDKPEGAWSDSVISAMNQSMLSLATANDNIELKQIEIVVPDPWVKPTLIGTWAGKGDSVYFAKLYDGSCQVRGSFINGTPATIAFRLPQQCIPAQSGGVNIVCSANSLFGLINVTSAGDVIPFVGTTPWQIQARWMCLNNRPEPLKCFPLNVQTRFKTPPKAVVALSNYRVAQDRVYPTNAAGQPQWRFINTKDGPVVQITDITGLEYGCRQKITIAIIGG